MKSVCVVPILLFFSQLSIARSDANVCADPPLSAWLDMWNRKDLNVVDDLFLNSPSEVTYFSSESEGLIVGLDRVRDHHAGLGLVPGGLKEVPTVLSLEGLYTQSLTSAFPCVKVVSAVWVFTWKHGEKEPMKGPCTLVYRQEEGDEQAWIVHMNFGNYERGQTLLDSSSRDNEEGPVFTAAAKVNQRSGVEPVSIVSLTEQRVQETAEEEQEKKQREPREVAKGFFSLFA
uniref:SnoaL-like domain-containing protein n=1 Tax=Chromera velia CCMP2878 TaxID=1169474 RepID=A0A0G4I5R1_9ALVE|mmetsp:Transcript_36781/g.72355  ORF Transcript_36781/g.72355 Transcript_36781/m.72355 type:complete len:231 (+) Transcript_36781:155-847(+)|eukprot:Cvel_11170.t1-p1 / transcript=Cvel_11170.t1 / gene=Cvel_11170 / organism=Chromera_velia_CCMP2878 / gene_product=hypothetical protein / transcript_product=hypothetical protein / location=Cvel_scaffold693:34354-35043(+) / protein_length=230 / sequence_SO=supercontig / SO=protein_coding / is_pseudo=false